MSPTDQQLKQALAKMLPQQLDWRDSYIDQHCNRVTTQSPNLVWMSGIYRTPALDTELLHLCWLVEETIEGLARDYYYDDLAEQFGDPEQDGLACYYQAIHATWQQRVLALCKVKGVEIV